MNSEATSLQHSSRFVVDKQRQVQPGTFVSGFGKLYKTNPVQILSTEVDFDKMKAIVEEHQKWLEIQKEQREEA